MKLLSKTDLRDQSHLGFPQNFHKTRSPLGLLNKNLLNEDLLNSGKKQIEIALELLMGLKGTD
jgi:hypothetical protein